MKTNKYRCTKCKKIIPRESDKKWMKSYCDAVGTTGRLYLIAEPSKAQSILAKTIK